MTNLTTYLAPETISTTTAGRHLGSQKGRQKFNETMKFKGYSWFNSRYFMKQIYPQFSVQLVQDSMKFKISSSIVYSKRERKRAARGRILWMQLGARKDITFSVFMASKASRTVLAVCRRREGFSPRGKFETILANPFY
jgi:hypothetical protein